MPAGNPSSRPLSRLSRLTLDLRPSFVLVIALCFAVFASPVRAHAIVVESTPAANAVVPAGALALSVGFNTRLDLARSRLSVESPDGVITAVAIASESTPTAIVGRTGVGIAGRWKVRWQVLAADGHITRGEIPFRVRAIENPEH